MKSENLNKIKELLIKYAEAKTSLEEENALIAFFNSKDVPQELVDFQAEFNYYATFRNIHFTESINEPLSATKNTLFENIGQLFSKWFTVVIIVGIAALFFILNQQDRQTEELLTTQFPELQNHPTLLNIDSTTKEEITSLLDTIPEFENRKHPKTVAPHSIPKKDVTTPDSLQLQQDNPIKLVHPPFQKKDSFIIPEIGSRSIEDAFLDDSSTLSTDSIDITKPDLEKVVFNLTERTKTGVLAGIARKAKQAGIEYTYVVDQHRKTTHELNIVMIIRSTGERSQLWISVPKKGSFSETICWSVDENGQAVSLCPGKIEHKVKAKHPIK